MNGSAPVVDAKADRVRRAMRELEYRPATAAQVLARRRTKTVGLLLSRISGDYVASLLRGIETEVSAAGMNLLVSTAGAGRSSALGEHNTDGLLVFADGMSDDDLRFAWARRHPVVLLHRTPPRDLAIPSVTVENKGGARQLVDHLIEAHGARSIAYLRGPAGHEDSRWRELGYRDSLAAHGITVDPDLIGDGGFTSSGGERQAAAWIAGGLAFDAVFAGDDAAAVGVLQALRRLAPERRVAVVGFDDTPLARHVAPSLTTVRAPTEAVGSAAVRRLLEMGSADPEAPLLTLLPTHIVLRRSCGCPGDREEQG